MIKNVNLALSLLLVLSGCADQGGSSSNNPPTAANAPSALQPAPQAELKPVKASEARECSTNEFTMLQAWRNSVDQANSAIVAAKTKQTPAAVQASLTAIRSCDSRLSYHLQQPCKKTKKTIVSTQVKVYDAFTIQRDCRQIENYLTGYNLRPEPNLADSVEPTGPAAPTAPTAPVQPPISTVPPANELPINPPMGSAAMVQCTNDQFSRLSSWSAQLDRANKSIARLGARANWKFDGAAISAATEATKSCESLIQYHSQNPCERNIKQDNGSVINRQYTQQTLSERCQTARTYFYEFVQNKESLNWPKADLFADFSQFSVKRFDAQSFVSVANCAIENRTDAVIDYSNRKPLIKETRGFDQKMLVFITEDGLKVDCYGLDLDGPFSKDQIVRLLKAEGVDLKLEYRLK